MDELQKDSDVAPDLFFVQDLVQIEQEWCDVILLWNAQHGPIRV